jgi:putative hydrolase of the HAD superfamily
MQQNTPMVVFDLDDTLYKEVDYLESAYREIAVFLESRVHVFRTAIFKEMLEWYYNGDNAFDSVISKYNPSGINTAKLLTIYRNHFPDIELPKDSRHTLENIQKMNIPIGIMTDGRSIQQRNKIRSLGLEAYTKDILISEEFGSEKPDVRNYKYFMKMHPASAYYYIGDNTKKDFIAANKLGWTTICLLDDGSNIHDQDFTLPPTQLPGHQIHQLKDSLQIIKI